jgi:probable HAF family extracellular repeat protein
MNVRVLGALLAAMPLWAAAAPPQYAVVDLGVADVAGAGLTWKDRKQPVPAPTWWPGGGPCAGNPPMPDVQAQFDNFAVGNVCQDERLGYVAAEWNIGSTVTLTILGLMPGAKSGFGTDGDYASALDFNTRGDIVGYSDSPYDSYIPQAHSPAAHGFIYNNGTWTDLIPIAGTSYNSAAEGINDSREVVGWTNTISSETGAVLQRAFIYIGGTMYNLTFYLAGGPTVKLSDAYGIDCQGNISATGTPAAGGRTHSYLLVRQGTARTSCPQ